MHNHNSRNGLSRMSRSNNDQASKKQPVFKKTQFKPPTSIKMPGVQGSSTNFLSPKSSRPDSKKVNQTISSNFTGKLNQTIESQNPQINKPMSPKCIQSKWMNQKLSTLVQQDDAKRNMHMEFSKSQKIVKSSLPRSKPGPPTPK